MNTITKDIFKAIHEGKWLSIEYKNKDENMPRLNDNEMKSFEEVNHYA